MIIGFEDLDGCWVRFEDVSSKGNWGLIREFVLSMAAKELAQGQVGDFRVSELVRPARVQMLERRHEYFVSPYRFVDMWEGGVLHAELARFNGVLREHNIVVPVHETTLSMTIDSYNNGVLKDFKWTKAYSHKMASKDVQKHHPEYHYQLNAYRWGLEKEGYQVDKMYLVMRLKDHSYSSWKGDMPEHPIMAVEVPIEDGIEQWISDRVEQLLILKPLPDKELPRCEDEERWKNSKGEYNRCKYYCGVAPFCYSIGEQFSWEKGYEACKKLDDDIDNSLLQRFSCDDPSKLTFRFQWSHIWKTLKEISNRKDIAS